MRLVLMRHAKSSWPHGVDDLDRPLTDRGVRDCAVAAAYLSAQPWRIEHAVVSPAVRTQQTWETVSRQLTYDISSELEPDIYEAGLGSLLSVLNRQTTKTIALVGHSPGMPRMALGLSDNQESRPAVLMRMKYPTLGIAVLEADLPWNEWELGCAKLLDFVVPRAEPHGDDID